MHNMAAKATEQQTEVRVGLIINGKEVETLETSPVYDPAAPAQVVGYAAAATQDQTTQAIDAADRAWPEWSNFDPERRAEMLLHSLEALRDDEAERAEILVRENGKVRAEAQVELQVFVNRCRLAAELAGDLQNVRRLSPTQSTPKPTLTGDGHKQEKVSLEFPFRSEVTTLPLGIVTIIIPYNWPLAILAASLPHALVAGNTVIVKPPPATPLSVVRTLRTIAAGLPPGVLNVITGTNEAVSPLISDPRIRRIVFTGSTTAGKSIMATAAKNVTRVTLELGGNDPALILDDAKLDDAALQRLVVSSFLTTGQVCMGIKRIYVHDSRYDEVVEGMSKILEGYRVGHGLKTDTTMGPLNNARQRDFVQELKEEAKAAGHEIREFGQIAEESVAAQGYFLKPALVLDPSPTLRIVQEEQFGPAQPILRYTDLDEVIAQTNTGWAGLCSSVWSSDLERAASVAARLRTGTTWINNANAVAEDDRAPFGGFRQSGLGRELGMEGLLEFVEYHTITYPA